MKDQGSVAPLIASYLALILLVSFSVANVGLSLVAGNRLQGVADYALLYAHDRSTLAGIPTESELRAELENFLVRSRSAKQLEIVSLRSWVASDTSHVEICARYRNLLGVGLQSALLCRAAAAKSYELPRGLSGA